jgi:GNAT superfamily N-acetyltransferase
VGGAVVADADGHVRGYYAMAAGAVSHQLATSGVRRNMPDPVPVMVLARLAVDHRAQGLHLGAALLQDAVNRAVAVSQNAGVRALLVHALHEKAKQMIDLLGILREKTTGNLDAANEEIEWHLPGPGRSF